VLDLTEVQTLLFVPEISLHLAPDTMALWEAVDSAVGDGEIPPPFWATAWPGGLGLARFVLDHPEVVAGREVIDIGTGSGMVAIAAALAGASVVTACDIDAVAIAAAASNARLNGVELLTQTADVGDVGAARGVLITAGDVFYSVDIARAMGKGLEALARAGAEVLIGDPHRPLLPDSMLEPMVTYDLAVDPAVEAVSMKETMVARLSLAPEAVGEAGLEQSHR
jgi:predicted nicotinamide N-methyase